MSQERFRVGLDEAGYGPSLGPLVVGIVRTDGSGAGLREALRAAGADAPEVKDSKLLFRGNLAPLERTALAAFTCARGACPRTVLEVLGGSPDGFDQHPWYAPLDLPVPVAATPAEVDAAATALFRGLRSSAVGLGACQAKPMLEGTFNGRLAHTRNKAQVELEIIEALLALNLPARPRGGVYCDRLGGRKNYGDWLIAQFPFWLLETEAETGRASEYVVRKGRHHVGFRFWVGGERRMPEIALASCIAKYVRELMMLLFNRFWTARRSIRPTAGYHGDARRFCADLAGDDEFEARRGMLVRQL